MGGLPRPGLRLDRDVAVKVAPGTSSRTPRRSPGSSAKPRRSPRCPIRNILAIHDFGNQDGIAYAVMELLEGDTLRERMDAGPLPQRKALDFALRSRRGWPRPTSAGSSTGT
jgi:serine/threonine protein kinase